MQNGAVIWTGTFKQDGCDVQATVSIKPRTLANLFANDRHTAAAIERAIVSGEAEITTKLNGGLILTVHRPREEG